MSFGVSTSTRLMVSVLAIFCMLNAVAVAYPHTPFIAALRARTEPDFPDQPPSCPICAQNYDNINSCAQAAPVLANFSMIIFNPGAFIDVIECACTDTFQSTYPQCVDCFERTNQTAFLNSDNLGAVVSGLQSVCAIASTLLGNVSDIDGEATPSSSLVTPTPTPAVNGNNGHAFGLVDPLTLIIGISVVFGLHAWL